MDSLGWMIQIDCSRLMARDSLLGTARKMPRVLWTHVEESWDTDDTTLTSSSITTLVAGWS